MDYRYIIFEKDQGLVAIVQGGADFLLELRPGHIVVACRPDGGPAGPWQR